MNRFVLALVSSASIAGGLVAMPSVAYAQVANVAPSAYVGPGPSPREPRGYDGGRRAAHTSGGAYPAPYPAHYAAPYTPYTPYTAPTAPYGASYPRGWPRDADGERREHWEGIRAQHTRACVRAYEGGAPPWVLARMQCPAY